MKSIISSLMLLFFLTGQVNLTLAAHYCGDELKSTEVTVAPEKTDCCGVDLEKNPDSDCCSDEYTSSDSDDYFGKANFQVQLSPEFILAYVLTIPDILLEDIEISNPKYLFPDRPIPDLNVLYQSFLI
ncbi:hypothetical protein SYJ56_11560 [Algoriphagus sp. D3-2-R+10]|uniref:HYC_CC_PP family protein n=1 Tax=Algoriphagus aurantiacus TaxID=3103948 RepID=UPI002B3FE2B9|nr:hypothetical protein [Algoriphagus sp. D3-2-R+10]MEB2775947.1 hypothetical protein [Algoriphagus sp. D3-2-R+10]